MWGQRAAVLVAFLIVGGVAPFSEAQSAENVAVVINDLSDASRRIGDHYARVRGVPAANVLRIRTSSDEVIEREEYVETIERPLGLAISRAGLQDRLLYIVLTKGIPLRVRGTTGLEGTGASVDSELTLLYRRLTGGVVPLAGMVDNPYFAGAREPTEAQPFSHRVHDIYLVTRLDGFSVEDVFALIDRAQTPQMAQGTIVLDQRAALPDSQVGDEWLARARERLTALGIGNRIVLETTTKAAAPVDAALGLSTWGAADPAHRRRASGMTFVPGAIAANLASFDARTFRTPPADWQPTASQDRTSWFEGSPDALIGDLIREGVTGVAGQVSEAYARGAVRPDVLFPAYLSGFNLAEAFYLSMPALSWQTVIVGDPLTLQVAGRRLSPSELDDRVDAATGLPALFAARRIASLAAANPDIPETAIGLMLRALGLLQHDDKAAAAQALREAVRQSPRKPDWMTTLGSLQEQAGDYDAAIATYQDALKVTPDNMVALNNLAFALAVHAGRPADALSIARRAVTLAPKSATIIDTLAWIEHLLGNHDEASKLLADAVRLAPKHPEIRLHAAIVYAAINRWKQSAAELTEALRLDPTLDAREEVRQLRARIK